MLLGFLGTIPAFAHRLDEYLQATTVSLDKEHVGLELRLTPGAAVHAGHVPLFAIDYVRET